MADKKVFTLEIDGVKQSYENVVKLYDVLNKIKDVTASVSVETDKAGKATTDSTNKTREKAKALTEEEKAEKKLQDTRKKREQLDTPMARAQALANQDLRERARLLNQNVEIERSSIGSIDSMRAQLSILGRQYRALGEEERNAEHIGGAMLQQIQQLREEYNQLERSLGNHAVNVGNYESATNGLRESFQSLGDGVNRATESTKGMLGLFQAGVGIALMFDESNDELGKTMNSLGKIMAIVGALQQANNTLIKSGTLSQIAYSLQNKVRIGLDALVTKGIITQTTAQTALNVATAAFPLLAIVAVLATVIGLFTSFSSETDKASGSANRYKSSIDGMSFATQEAVDKHDDFLRKIRDIQIEIDVTNGKITEYQASLLRLAYSTSDAIEESKKELIKNLGEIDKEYDAWYKKLGKSFMYYITGQDDKVSLDALERERLERRKQAQENATEEMKNIFILDNKQQEQIEADKNKKQREKAKDQSRKLAELIKERNRTELELTRQSEDNKTNLISDEFEKRESQIRVKYERQKDDLEKRLNEEKNLTEKSRNAINEIIANLSSYELEELKKVDEDRSKLNESKIAKQKETWEKIKKLNKDYLDNEIKDNEDATNRVTLELTQQLGKRQISKEAYEAQMLNISIDSLLKEIAIRRKYGEDTTGLEIELSERRIDQAELEKNKVSEHFKKLHETLQKYVDGVMTSVTAIFDATNSVLQSQLDEANEKYEAISQKYDDVVEKREESDSRLQELEEEAKNARGGRALVLQEQINSEMVANQQLANQEKQLAKEKEKQENEIAKKEKQIKKVELTQNIVQGIANTALGVTKALEWGFPLGPVFAAIVGAMGAVQVGVMTSQLAKLEDGGLLRGKRHSQGGMRVEGTNIEVEGGEYVINRESTDRNIGLVKYINSQRRTLGPGDLSSFFSKSAQSFEPPFKKMFADGGRLPAVENTVSIDNDALVDAIQGIKIEPKVSVVDINKAQNNLVSIDDIVGM